MFLLSKKKCFFSLLLSLLAQYAHAQGMFENPVPSQIGMVVERGLDYEVLSVKAEQYNGAILQGTGKTGTATQAKRIYVIKSFTGVVNSTLPYDVKNEILEDHGGSMNKMPAAEPVTIFIDEELAIQSARTPDIGIIDDERIIQKNTNQKSLSSLSFSCKKWYSWSKSDYKQNIPNIGKKIDDINEPGFVGEAEASLGTRGFVSASAKGRYKVNRCVSLTPYKIELKDAFIKGEMYMDNATLALRGNVLNYQKSLFETTLYEGYFDVAYFCVWFICFDLDADIEAKAGLKFGVNVAASLGYKGLLNGYMKFNYRCRAGDCFEYTPTEKNFQVSSEQNEWLASIEGKVHATPWASVDVGMLLGLYHRELPIASAMANVNLSLPIAMHGYYGNDCGDSNQDGSNETVKGLTFDISALLALSVELKALGGKVIVPIPVALQDWVKDEDCDGCILKRFDHLYRARHKKVIGKSLYYRDLIPGGSTIYSPITSGLYDTGRTFHPTDHMASLAVGTLHVSARQCNDLGTSIKHLVDWGDGTTEYVNIGSTSPTPLSHRWAVPMAKGATFKVRVTPISDSFGRKLSPTTTVRQFSM